MQAADPQEWCDPDRARKCRQLVADDGLQKSQKNHAAGLPRRTGRRHGPRCGLRSGCGGAGRGGLWGRARAVPGRAGRCRLRSAAIRLRPVSVAPALPQRLPGGRDHRRARRGCPRDRRRPRHREPAALCAGGTGARRPRPAPRGAVAALLRGDTGGRRQPGGACRPRSRAARPGQGGRRTGGPARAAVALSGAQRGARGAGAGRRGGR